jgi:hypothetical protein
MRFFCRCVLSGAAFLTQLTGTGAPIKYSWSGVVTSATSFLDPTYPLPALGSRYRGEFTYDPDAWTAGQTLGSGCWISWTRYDIYDDTTKWSNSKQDVFAYEEFHDFSCGQDVLLQTLYLRSNDSSLFTLGTPLPAKLPPLKVFDIHEFNYDKSNHTYFFTVTLDTLSGPDDSGIETKISSVRKVGTNLVINFTAPSSSTIYLQRLLSTNWTDAMQIGGWKGVFTLPLPTNGLGFYRLKKTN